MIDIFSFTSQGGREYNEDSVGYAYTTYGAVMAVADGLGAHKGSEVASQVVVDTLLKEPLDDNKNDKDWLRKRLETANQAILAQQAAQANKMKSTVVALKISGTKATWAHLGDSRLYYLHNREIAAVTEDHSVAFKKYRAASGDGFLLCSDGFWEHVQDQEILFDFLKTNNAQTWTEHLLLRAIERLESDSDNLSVIAAVIR